MGRFVNILPFDPNVALGPFQIAGTDHSPDKLRCMHEGVYAGVRYAATLFAIRDFWTQIAIAVLFAELWEVGTWGNNSEWIETLFESADAIERIMRT